MTGDKWKYIEISDTAWTATKKSVFDIKNEEKINLIWSIKKPIRK